jgi:hypothetical protein
VGESNYAKQSMTSESDTRVTIADVADELQAHRPTIFKIVRRLGIETLKRRDENRGNQMVDTIAVSDVDQVRKALVVGRRSVGEDSQGAVGDGMVGYFYVVQLEPNHDPGRFKVGFSTDMDGRMAKHRCSAPFAKCIRQWPCFRSWEKAAIDCVTAGCEKLHTEVFRAKSIEDVIKRCEAFFNLMPSADICVAEDSAD